MLWHAYKAERFIKTIASPCSYRVFQMRVRGRFITLVFIGSASAEVAMATIATANRRAFFTGNGGIASFLDAF